MTVLALIVAFVSGLLLSACGGGEERRDVDEPEGTFPVRVVEAEFPTRQRLAEAVELELTIENTGDKEIPDLAITIVTRDPELEDGVARGSFLVREDQVDLEDPNRPVWVLERGWPRVDDEAQPAGAEVAHTNTFAFGSLAPGERRRAAWRVTPVRGGTFVVTYRIAAGTEGKARAVDENGQSPPRGMFQPTVATDPPQTRVDDEGNVVEIPRDDPHAVPAG